MSMGRYGTKVGELVAEGQFDTAAMLIELMQAVDSMAELSANLFTCANNTEMLVEDWRARWEQMKESRNSAQKTLDEFAQRVAAKEANEASAAKVVEILKARHPLLISGLHGEYMSSGRKIDAIKLLRAETGMGLKDAKDEIERRWKAAGYPI